MVRNAVVDSGSSIGAQNCSVNKPVSIWKGNVPGQEKSERKAGVEPG